NRVRALAAEPGSYRPLQPEALYVVKDEWDGLAAERPIHLVSQFPEPESHRTIDFQVEAARDFAPERAQQVNIYEAVAQHISALRRSGRKVVLASYTKGARDRLSGLLDENGLKAQTLADSWQEALGSKTQPALLVLPLDHGFTTRDVAVLTEQDMLGDRLVRRRRKRKAAAAFLEELATLSPGDLVVHADPGASYPQFVDRFPYEETDDQDRAIEDVLKDLETGKPMDRLVCGDVGFGKTEVALRAAFVMAMSGKQVALVCPTTLLARQHY